MTNEELLEKIKKYMRDTDFSIPIVAAGMGVADPTLRRFLNNEGDPRSTTLRKMKLWLKKCKIDEKTGEYTGEYIEEAE